ncbi:MAG: DUF2793 domain-containing protein [Planctomycetota bacterium]
MTASLTDYKGLEVITPAPTGAGGLAIQENFKKLINWQYAVIDDTLTSPPGSPTAGDRYIVASPATGAWTGLENQLVEYIDPNPDPAYWDSLVPNVGIPVYVTSKQLLHYWDSTSWVPIVAGSGALAQVFDAYDATGGQTFTTAEITLNLDTVRKNSDANLFSLASDELTINEAGTYIFIFRVSTDVSTGNARSASKCWIETDTGGGFATVAGSEGFMYNRTSSLGDNTATVQLALDAAAGDKFRIRANRVNGTDTIATKDNGSGMTVYRLGMVGTAGDPAGSDAQVQFNNAGVFGADPNFTYDAASSALQVDNISIDGNTVSATDTNGNLILSPDGTGALQANSGGNARGNNAVDLQTGRSDTSEVAGGLYSTVSGGYGNTAEGWYCTVGGGSGNTATDNGNGNLGYGRCTVGGGAGNSAGFFDSTVSGGNGNTADGWHCTIGAGLNNTASGSGCTVSGGYNNISSSNYSMIGGGVYNSASHYYSTIGGGIGNNCTNTDATISGGSINTASGPSSTVGGGNLGKAGGAADASYTTVSGGNTNWAGGLGATVGGGAAHNTNAASVVNQTTGAVTGTTTEVVAGNFSTIAGGQKNTATGSNSTVGAGANNTASGSSSIVSGGFNNTASGYASTVGGGGNIILGNTASGGFSTVSGGIAGTASGSSSIVSGGFNNTASGYASTISGGRGNTASGYASISGGDSNTASGDYSMIPGGAGAEATKYGQFAHAAGSFATTGDAQVSTLIARNSTTNATATDLFLNGSSNHLTIPADTAWVFFIDIAATEQGMANFKKFQRAGGIINDGGTTSISTVDTIGTDSTIGLPGSWSVSITADNTNDALGISVTGAASTNIRWVARATLTEVSYPA